MPRPKHVTNKRPPRKPSPYAYDGIVEEELPTSGAHPMLKKDGPAPLPSPPQIQMLSDRLGDALTRLSELNSRLTSKNDALMGPCPDGDGNWREPETTDWCTALNDYCDRLHYAVGRLAEEVSRLDHFV